ncbi:MAG: hypothetical protein FJX74_19475, partial [Armatimonadetes bacterium]|nr:hypothetical protein [Armatimonadota bacterium]
MFALAMAACSGFAVPGSAQGAPGQLRVAIALPHVPGEAWVAVVLDGQPAPAFRAYEGVGAAPLPAESPGAHSLSLSVTDPQVQKRLLYSRSLSAWFPGDAESAIIFGLDGAAWGAVDAATDPVQALWDPRATLSSFLAASRPEGDVTATAEVGVPDASTLAEAATVARGTGKLQVTVTVTNGIASPVRVLACGLRVTAGEADASARFFALPTCALPTLIPAGGSAQQTFRLDTFDDTPPGDYAIEPLVAWVPAEADLLADGAFEEPGPLPRATAEPAEGWRLSSAAPEGAQATVAPGGASYAELADRVCDWRDFTALPFANATRVAAQGTGLLELLNPPQTPPAPGVVAVERRISGIEGGQRHWAGVSSWSGSKVRVELLDDAGNAVAGQERNFTGFWWADSAANWTGRSFAVNAPSGVTHARLVLEAAGPASWWDNVFLVPEGAIRRGRPQPARLAVTVPQAETPDVVYLGEDRETQGNWIGNYGSYCWTLCAMSAPRDMVGGQAKPLKCRHDDLSQAYANETIRVTGTEEFRYCSWTGNPADVLTRHWIGVMRTEEERALENPQWGYRTYASWDEHGETHPTDACGPDLYVKLRMPPGLWQVALYFLDWDWWAAPFPRAHRLAFLDEGGNEACTARVADFGPGVYKLFGVVGGRDVTLRIRKDFSATVVLSGLFLDRLEPPALPETLDKPLRAWDGERAERLDQLRLAAVDRPAEYLRGVAGYREVANALPREGPQWAQEARYRLLAAAPGALTDEAEAFKAYLAGLPAASVVTLGDEAFARGDLRHAELAYDAALAVQAKQLTGEALANAYKERATQFRILHPLYAASHCRGCLQAVKEMPAAEATAYLRAAASELFDLAGQDWKAGRGMVRVQYALPTALYTQLAVLAGYGALTREEQQNLVLCYERQTWYDLGFEDLAFQFERFIGSLPQEQVTGALLQGLLRAYGVVCQRDPSCIAKAEQLV